MPDSYEHLRSLSFPVVIGALGFDPQTFKTRKGGHEYYGRCPIHSAKTNTTSFSYLSDGKFNCFSCSAKGRGAIDLAKAVKQIGFKEACELLQRLSGHQPPNGLAKEKSPLVVDSEASGIVNPSNLDCKPLPADSWRKFQVPCAWLEARCPDAAVRELYGVFCYNNPARKSIYSGRVMLPVRDMQGNLYGYLGRAVDTAQSPHQNSDIPKYLFPKGLGKSRFLFGADVLKAGKFGPAPLKRIFLLESPFAVMKFATMGLPAVSPFGWSVSPEQVRILLDQTICRGAIFLPDRNKYSECGAVVSLLAQHLWLRFPPLPVGIDDPEYLTKEQVLAL